MFTRDIYETTMTEFQVPEIKRTPLEQIILQIYIMKLTENTPTTFLSKAIEIPDDANIKSAMNTLRDIGALDAVTSKLTPLGYHLANLPVGAKLGKLLLYGCLFRCIEPILTVAVSIKIIFKSERESVHRVYGNHCSLTFLFLLPLSNLFHGLCHVLLYCKTPKQVFFLIQ